MDDPNVDRLVLTIPELAALMAGGDRRATTAGALLGIDMPGAEVALAGLSSLFARGLLDATDAVPRVAATVRSVVGVIAESLVVIRIGLADDQRNSVTNFYSAESLGVLATPIGFGCFEFRFVDLADGLGTILKTTAQKILTGPTTTLLLEAVHRDSDSTSVAVTQGTDGWRLVGSDVGVPPEPETDTFWRSVVDQLNLERDPGAAADE